MRAHVIVIAVVGAACLYLVARPGAREAKPRAPAAPRTTAERPSASARASDAEHERSRARLNARLSELEGRLNEVERERPADPPEPPAAPEHNDLSDVDVAAWMDGHLDAQSDPAASEQAASQLGATIARIERPDLRVEDIRCGERFCRATFYQDSGERPVVRDLYGPPPITGEGFTVDEPDGRLAVYFARNGEHVRDFRDEALLASAP